GAAIAPATEVVGITVRGNRVVAVRTDRGEVACANAVLCAGPFSVALAQTVGIRLPIELRIRRRLIFPDLAEVPPDAPMTIDDDSGAHWRPAGRGAFVLFAEPAAAPGPALDPVPAAADFYETVMAPNGPAAVARTTPFWRRVWERGSDPWTVVAGQYSYTPDGHPLLGATPIAGLFVNCGDNGHGAMCSPARARIVAESILGSLRPAANPFRLDRPLAPARTDRL
ncbi:MAG: NAD(P)/FAD-dependent oxidoreductase, partial [Vulcanimicrobiaceae bacterium]